MITFFLVVIAVIFLVLVGERVIESRLGDEQQWTTFKILKPVTRPAFFYVLGVGLLMALSTYFASQNSQLNKRLKEVPSTEPHVQFTAKALEKLELLSQTLRAVDQRKIHQQFSVRRADVNCWIEPGVIRFRETYKLAANLVDNATHFSVSLASYADAMRDVGIQCAVAHAELDHEPTFAPIPANHIVLTDLLSSSEVHSSLATLELEKPVIRGDSVYVRFQYSLPWEGHEPARVLSFDPRIHGTIESLALHLAVQRQLLFLVAPSYDEKTSKFDLFRSISAPYEVLVLDDQSKASEEVSGTYRDVTGKTRRYFTYCLAKAEASSPIALVFDQGDIPKPRVSAVPLSSVFIKP